MMQRMIRATILVSGDPQSLGRGAEDVKLAIEAELSFYGLENEIEVLSLIHISEPTRPY